MKPDPNPGPSTETHARTTSPTLGHQALRDTLMAMLDVDPDASAAFNSRLRRTLTTLGHDVGVPRRRTPNRRHGVLTLLETALAMQLQRGYVEPGVAARMVTEMRPTLPELWRRVLVKRDGFMLRLPLDAFASQPAGTIVATGPADQANPFRQSAVGATTPMLTIDLGTLAQRAMDALGSLGWMERDVVDAVLQATSDDH